MADKNESQRTPDPADPAEAAPQNAVPEGYVPQDEVDAMMGRRAKEAAHKAREKLLADLGYDDPQQLKDSLEALRMLEDDQSSEAEKHQKEVQRQKERAEKAEANAKAASEKAAQRVIAAEAKVQALEAGARPDRVNAVLRLTDLSEVDLGEDGEPDTSAIKRLLSATLKEFPEFGAGEEPPPPDVAVPSVSRPAGQPPTGTPATGQKDPQKERGAQQEQRQLGISRI